MDASKRTSAMSSVRQRFAAESYQPTSGPEERGGACERAGEGCRGRETRWQKQTPKFFGPSLRLSRN